MDLNQITIPSQDLSKSVPFYEKLGLELIVESLPHYARFACPNGSSTLSLHHTNELPKGEGVWIYFECENLDEQVELLKGKGIEFELDPTDQDWLWQEAKLKDLDGNQIILFYAGENRLNPPWRITNTKDNGV
ncbi:MAG: VOC family protein [Bacteroidota bacterium]